MWYGAWWPCIVKFNLPMLTVSATYWDVFRTYKSYFKTCSWFKNMSFNFPIVHMWVAMQLRARMIQMVRHVLCSPQETAFHMLFLFRAAIQKLMHSSSSPDVTFFSRSKQNCSKQMHCSYQNTNFAAQMEVYMGEHGILWTQYLLRSTSITYAMTVSDDYSSSVRAW